MTPLHAVGHDSSVFLPAPRSARPNISIVLLSRSDAELERAMRVVGTAAEPLNAQLVLVCEETTGASRERIVSMAKAHPCALAWVGAGSDRSAMTDEGLKHVTGDIVTCREDNRVGDGEWLVALGRYGAPVRRADVSVPVVVTDERPAEAPGRTTHRSSHVMWRRSDEASEIMT